MKKPIESQSAGQWSLVMFAFAIIVYTFVILSMSSCSATKPGCSQKMASKPNKIGAYYRR